MSDKYWIEYLERKSSLNYDEYLENRVAELEKVAETLKEERGRLRDALTLINDRASYFLGVNEEWLIDITKAALLGGGE